MKIGLTYDLRQDYLDEGYSLEETAEFDKPETVDGIDAALDELGYETDRIGNAKQLISRLAAGDRWDLVFNIAEGFHGIAREAQVPAILDVFNIPYTFSDPLVLSLALHKGITKSIVRHSGLATPDFALVETESQIDAVNLPFPLFAKPVAEGTSKGISGASKIVNRQALREVCVDLLEKFRQPVLVETFLSGREFTVGVTGTGEAAVAVGTMEILLLAEAEAEVYSYENKAKYENRVRYRLVRPADDQLIGEVERLTLAAWQVLNCRDGGRVDIRCDAAGVPSFIEVNPLPGLNPDHSDLPIVCGFAGVPYIDLIDRIVNSARRRIVKHPAAANACL